jgi:hypothetical protein
MGEIAVNIAREPVGAADLRSQRTHFPDQV